MGNSASSGRGHHEDTVDFGYLTPQGVYTGSRDWNQTIVIQLICERKLAPYYRPLEDYDESWDDEQIFAARKEPPDPDGGQSESHVARADSVNSSSSKTHHKRPSAAKEVVRQPHPEAAVYRGAVECPICFLYYPPNINHSRCCDQAICTECFVQIKRADPTTTHLVSEPASCPYCVQENFGVVYTPPPWRAGINSEGATPPSWPDSPRGSSSQSLTTAAMQRRRKSFNHDSPEVVTIDQIRPDWEAKLAAVRAAVTRRANRRIIMRQVGDRLIPVGVTSGRVHALPTEDGQGEGGADGNGSDRGSRRSRRRGQNADINQLLGSMGLGGQDLEELMVMEAMRLSLIEHEEQQRKEREEEEKKKEEEGASEQAAVETPSNIEGAGSSSTPAVDTPSTTSTSTHNTDTSSTATLISSSPSSAVSAPVSSTLPEPADGTDNSHSAVPGSSAHGSSLSVSGGLTADQPSGSRWKRRSSPSPFGVRAALQSATSTAQAVVSPGAGEDSSSIQAEIASTSTPSTIDSAHISTASEHTTSQSLPPTPTPDASEEARDTEETMDEAGEEVSTNDTDSQDLQPTLPIPIPESAIPLPLIHQIGSVASSIGVENSSMYDVLPSTPASTVSSLSRKPLLDNPVSDTANGNLSTPAQSL